MQDRTERSGFLPVPPTGNEETSGPVSATAEEGEPLQSATGDAQVRVPARGVIVAALAGVFLWGVVIYLCSRFL